MIPIEEKLKKFDQLITDAITVRENALHPENTLFELPLSVQGEEITLKEQNLLKRLLVQFRSVFEVEE